MRAAIAIKHFILALPVAFAVPGYAQSFSDTDVEVYALLGTKPSAGKVAEVATVLAARGEFTAGVTAALARADVDRGVVTVAVRQAIPSASNQQLARGLAQAGIAPNTAAAAIRTANLIKPPQTAPVSAMIDEGTGAIVGADGRALGFDTPQQKLEALAAFVSTRQELTSVQINALLSAAGTYNNPNTNAYEELAGLLSSTQSPRNAALTRVVEKLNAIARTLPDNGAAGVSNAINAINNLIASPS
jgi:hypothetical protein